LTEVLEQQGGELPTITKAIIALTGFFDVYWWLVLIVIVGALCQANFGDPLEVGKLCVLDTKRGGITEIHDVPGPRFLTLPFADFNSSRGNATLAALDGCDLFFSIVCQDESEVCEVGNILDGADVRGWKTELVSTAKQQTGIFASVRALLNSTVEVQFSFYLGSNAKVVPDVPDFKRDLSFKFNIKSFTPYGFLPTLEGDFNGDGLLDAVYGKDQENLYIILQSDPRKHNKSYDNFGAENAFTLYPAQTSYKGTFPISDQFFIADLNGDHLSDMVFWYDDWQKRHEVLVLVNLRKFF
jgi:hypothetical protein